MASLVDVGGEAEPLLAVGCGTPDEIAADDDSEALRADALPVAAVGVSFGVGNAP